MKELLQNENFIFIAAFFLSFNLILGVYYILGAKKCENKSISFESHNFMLLGGCMVLHNDRWIPFDKIRGESL